MTFDLSFSMPSKLVAFCTLAIAVASCSGENNAEPEIVRPAKLYTVAAPQNQFNTSFPAIIEAGRSSTLTFQVSGLLESLPVREGQAVRKGTPLARLDQRRYRNAVVSAQAEYTTAQTEYESSRRLLEEDAIARISVDQRRAKRDMARAKLDSASKDLADTVLRAPFAGLVAQRHGTQFENVQAGEDIITLQSLGTVEAVVSVPVDLIQRLASNEGASSYVVLSSNPDLKIPGQFLSARTLGDTESQTFQVKFAFHPPPGMIVIPGMTGTVYASQALTEGEGANGAVSVPLGSVQSDGKARYVWVVDKKAMTVKKRMVVVGDDVGANISVASGLKSGETIVAAGAAYLNDGQKIRPYTK